MAMSAAIHVLPPRQMHKPVRVMKTTPTVEQLYALPVAERGEYLLTAAEIQTLRSRIYSLHKDNAAGFRWITRVIDGCLMIWRVK